MQYLVRWAPELTAGIMGLVLWSWSGRGDLPVVLAVLATALGTAGIYVVSWVAGKLSREGNRTVLGKWSMFALVVGLATVGVLTRVGEALPGQAALGGVFFWAGLSCGLAVGAYGAYQQSR